MKSTKYMEKLKGIEKWIKTEPLFEEKYLKS